MFKLFNVLKRMKYLKCYKRCSIDDGMFLGNLNQRCIYLKKRKRFIGFNDNGELC